MMTLNIEKFKNHEENFIVFRHFADVYCRM